MPSEGSARRGNEASGRDEEDGVTWPCADSVTRRSSNNQPIADKTPVTDGGVDDPEPIEVRIGKGTPVIYEAEDGLTADLVTRVDGQFVDVGGDNEDRWLRVDDIIATGIYGDQPGVEVVLGD